MNCPNCKSEMEKGMSDGISWQSENFATKLVKIIGGKRVYAHRCPKCGKLEFVSEL